MFSLTTWFQLLCDDTHIQIVHKWTIEQFKHSSDTPFLVSINWFSAQINIKPMKVTVKLPLWDWQNAEKNTKNLYFSSSFDPWYEKPLAFNCCWITILRVSQLSDISKTSSNKNWQVVVDFQTIHWPVFMPRN